MVYAGRPKKGAHTPCPCGGTWSGNKATASPDFSALSSCFTPASVVGAAARRALSRKRLRYVGETANATQPTTTPSACSKGNGTSANARRKVRMKELECPRRRVTEQLAGRLSKFC